MMIRQFILALTTLSTALATPWNTRTINAGPEVGAVSANTVDMAGRAHFFSASQEVPSGSYELIYSLRASGLTSFSHSSITSVPAAERPLFASMAVTDDYRIQLAVLTAAGMVNVWEQDPENDTWAKTVVGPCSTDLFAGVSLHKGKGIQASNSGVAFSAAGGGVHYSEQQADGSWSTPVVVSSGADSGLSPALIHTGFNSMYPGTPSHIVISYNRAENRIESNRFEGEGSAFPPRWLPAVQVAPAFTPTRLSAVGYGDTIGVAFVSNGDTNAANRLVRVQYATQVFGVHSWQSEDVSLVTEVNPAEERFGEQAALAFDAAGEPMIAYLREMGALGIRRTLDIRMRRNVPGLGWKLDIVEELSANGIGTYTTDELKLSTGANGDPVLTYERDGGVDENALSDFVFARPRFEPWTLGRPAALADFDYSSAPAICTSDSGAVHMVTNVGTRGFVFGAPFAIYQAPVVTTYKNGEVTTEQLPAPDELHMACGIATDASGAVHVIALRQSGPGEGSLHYYKRDPNPWSVFAEVGSSVPGNPAQLRPISMGAAADGRVFVAYYDSLNTIRIWWYDPATEAWAGDLGYPATIFTNFDLAVRKDGEFALSCFYQDAERKASLLTSVNPVTGLPITSSSPLQLYEVGDDSPSADLTSCVFGEDGLPRFAYLVDDTITLARPDPDSATFFSLITIGSGIGERSRELIKLAYRNGTAHILAATTDEGGSLWHHRLKEGGELRSIKAAETGLEIHRSFNTVFAHRDLIALTLDQFGEPIVALATIGPVITGANAETVVLTRPADFIDADGDGIPLLLEEAHCLDRSLANPLSDTTQTEVTLRDDHVRITHEFRSPAIPNRPSSRGITFGEFGFFIEVSPDLATWAPRSSLPLDGYTVGEPAPISIPGDSSCDRGALILEFAPSFSAANSRYFTRLRVHRNR